MEPLFFFFFLTAVVSCWVGLRGRWRPDSLQMSSLFRLLQFSIMFCASTMWLQAFWLWNRWRDLVSSSSNALLLLASCQLQDPVLSYHHSVFFFFLFKPVATISVWIVHLQLWGKMRETCQMFHGAGQNSLPGDKRTAQSSGDFKPSLKAHSFTRETYWMEEWQFFFSVMSSFQASAPPLCSQLDFSIFHYTLARAQCKYPAVALVNAPVVVRHHLCGLSLC